MSHFKLGINFYREVSDSPTRCADMTRGTWEEAGLIVLNGGLGAAGRIAPGIFWNAAFKGKNQYEWGTSLSKSKLSRGKKISRWYEKL